MNCVGWLGRHLPNVPLLSPTGADDVAEGDVILVRDVVLYRPEILTMTAMGSGTSFSSMAASVAHHGISLPAPRQPAAGWLSSSLRYCCKAGW
jgi:hydroxymethylpyrimidine/phosphomethylpyrimidine kinase